MFGLCEQTPTKNSEPTDSNTENNSTPKDTLVSGEKRKRGRPKGSKNAPKRALLDELNASTDPSKTVTKSKAITKEASLLNSNPRKSLRRKMSVEIVEPQVEHEEGNMVEEIKEVKIPIKTNTSKKSEQSEKKKNPSMNYRDNAQVEKSFLEDLEILSDNSESPTIRRKKHEKLKKMVEEKKMEPIVVREKVVEYIEERPKSEDNPRIHYRNFKDMMMNFNEPNSVVVYNIESRVDEEILYELFCKAGRIKRMNLYRINGRDLDNSQYLQSLELSERSTMPHKKKAIIEYYSSVASNRAMELFHQLRLFGKKIFVMKHRDEMTNYNIVISRPRNELQWLDEFFLMDFLVQVCNPLRVSRLNVYYTFTKLFVYFYSPCEVDKAREHIRKELYKHLNHRVEIRYNLDCEMLPTSYQEKEYRDYRPKRFERSYPPAIRRSKPSRQVVTTQLSDLESGEETFDYRDRSP